jgi:hypothetical protein
MNLTFKTKAFGLVALLGIIASVMIICFQQLHLNIAKAQSETPLTLEISTPQHKYLQFEPIVIDLKLSNQTTDPINWNGDLHIGGNNINLLMRSANGNEVRWKGDKANVDIVLDSEVLQAGKHKEIQNLIDARFAEQLFSQPGRYQFRVEFNYIGLTYNQRQNVTIVSNPITIDIDEPKGKERIAYGYLKQNYQRVIDGGNIVEKTRVLQHFVDNFSNTPYGKYIIFDLGNTYLSAKEYEKAEEAFYQISDVDFYYSKQVGKHLGELAGKLKRPSPRTKRPPDYSNAPVGRPMPAITPVRTGPVPTPIVPIYIPNANPNTTPTP